MGEAEFTHFDERGNAFMVDVSGKNSTKRRAVAVGTIHVTKDVLDAIEGRKVKKGDVLTVAQVAGIMAVKQTSSLIPMCHLLNLTNAKVWFKMNPDALDIHVYCQVKTEGLTGVEMEALTGVSVALLTIYDMCKAIDKRMVMTDIHLVEKSGGKSGGFYFRETDAEPEKPVYLDHAAGMRLSQGVLEAMKPYLGEEYGNPSTLCRPGQLARKGMEENRRILADLLGASASEVCFTSGGTEADNWALTGAMEAARGGHLITDKTEHPAVLRTCRYLEQRGFSVTYLDPDPEGYIRPEQVIAAIRPDTKLVSIMTANNEIGTIQPIAQIGKALRAYEEKTGRRILFHTDAVQAFGHITLNVESLGVDLLSASAHKLGGPRGIGLLYMRKGVHLSPLIHGGAQEQGRRAGTENTAAVAGFAAAALRSCRQMEEEGKREIVVRDHLIRRLLAEVPGTVLNGPDPGNKDAPGREGGMEGCTGRLPDNVNVCLEGISGESLVLLLDRNGIYAGTGSACSSGSSEPSHVLMAIGRTYAQAFGSLRLTIGEETSMEDADRAVDEIKKLAEYIRGQRTD